MYFVPLGIYVFNPALLCAEDFHGDSDGMPANLENSAVATGLEKVSFHSNPKEGHGK